jgi:soluble lytic murein transglycosylase
MAEAVGLLAAGDPAGAARKVEPLASSGSPGARRGAALIAARAAARERRFQDAIAAWRTVAATRDRIPGLPSAAQTALGDDAPYFAAWLHFDLGDVARAALELERYARERPRSRRAEDARWFAAWALIRSGDVPAARRALERAEDVPRVRYWRARIATDPDVARELLQSVVTAEPFGYYGLIACARLRSSGTACAEPNLPPGLPPPDPALGADAALLTRAAALAASGLRDEAIELLSSLPFTQGSRAAAPQAAQLAHYLGDPVLPFRLARDRIGLSRATLAWSFPDPWPRLVAASASAAGVDPSLLRAVMRRESGFRTGVVSSAGAVGLLQLLPSTAARLSSLLGQPPPSPSRLELPAVNIPLGAGYFGLLLERFGDPALAIAAYNAGPRAVSRWRQEGPPMALDAWVESIPYRETRQYVRAVLENWAGARAAVGAPPPAIDPDRIIAEPGAGIAF